MATTVTPSAEPSRTHYQYTWDVRGQVTGIQKLGEDRPRTRTQTLGSSSHHTIQWPFQNSSQAGAETATIPTLPSRGSLMNLRRAASWDHVRPASSVLDMDIVPDYVINFMRGETPETLARKRQRLLGAQSPHYHHHTHKQSCTADFCAMSDDSLLHHYDDMEKGRPRSPRYLKKIMTGWRGGVALSFILALVMLFAAAGCLAAHVIHFGSLPPHASIRDGDCDSIRNLNMGIHVVVNVVGVVLLTGASYIFQVLTSPTRAEVDSAHARQLYLDIGIPSLRNLVHISKLRALLATLILPLAVGSLVIYNSLVFVGVNQDSPLDAPSLVQAESCRLDVNGPLLVVTGILNLLIVFVLALALVLPSLKPLATLGDAVASFLSEPDITTRDACLMTKADVKGGQWGARQAKVWAAESHRWMQTPSMIRWSVWALTWIIPTAAAGVALALTLIDEAEDAFSSFSNLNSVYTVSFGAQHFALAMLVSLPHILLGILYLSTNALFTLFFLSHEFSQFAVPNRFTPLRVSSGQPDGSQISSLYLTLPRPISWLLLFLFMAMGFMLSQAVYLVSTEGDADDWEAAIGVSPLPLAVLLGLLLVVGSLVLGFSLRTADPTPTVDDGQPAGNPLTLKGGSCSAVISARCHRAVTESENMTIRDLGWGVVGGEMAGSIAAHATFSAGPVGAINVGEAYA